MFILLALAGRFLLESQVSATHLRPVRTTRQTNKLDFFKEKNIFWIETLHTDRETNLQKGKQSYENKSGILLLTEDHPVHFKTFRGSSEETEDCVCQRLCFFFIPFKQMMRGKTKIYTPSDKSAVSKGAAGGPKFHPTFSLAKAAPRFSTRLRNFMSRHRIELSPLSGSRPVAAAVKRCQVEALDESVTLPFVRLRRSAALGDTSTPDGTSCFSDSCDRPEVSQKPKFPSAAARCSCPTCCLLQRTQVGGGGGWWVG